jgi:hypothetical protein
VLAGAKELVLVAVDRAIGEAKLHGPTPHHRLFRSFGPHASTNLELSLVRRLVTASARPGGTRELLTMLAGSSPSRGGHSSREALGNSGALLRGTTDRSRLPLHRTDAARQP